jgi:hypothetical protein
LTDSDLKMKQDIINQIIPYIEPLRSILPVGEGQDSKLESEDTFLKGIDVVASMTSRGTDEKAEDMFDLSRI